MATIRKKKIYIAMSGGVDSSLAAALLKEQGHEVIGVHIKMWSDPSIPCNFKEDRYDAMRAAEKIGVPFQTWDLTAEYRSTVVEYMIREYAAGRTPNPDVMCNRHIKFGIFLKRALERGADYVATGHYVRLQTSKNPVFYGAFERICKADRDPPCQVIPSYLTHVIKSRDIFHKAVDVRGVEPRRPFLARKNSSRSTPTAYSLYQARDKNKDQSYFLWTLTQERLRHALFPIGEYTKPEVRAMARERGLPTAEKKDSQGICFIGEIDLRAFLQRHIPVSRGPILTTSGKAVGEHEGLAFYTIGQREGLSIGGGGIPYYAAEKDFATNTLVVAEGPYDEKLFARETDITDVHWISGREPHLPLRCEARIRYRQPLQKCVVDLKPKTYNLQSRFDEPQRAVTPGQSIVFYKGEEMLGGGIICG